MPVSDRAKQFMPFSALKGLDEALRANEKIVVPKVEFSFETHTWKTGEYVLPCFNGDYVLLTPRDMLTRDDTFINEAGYAFHP